MTHPVGEYSYAFPTLHVCSPRELIHCLYKEHDPSKCAQCLHWVVHPVAVMTVGHPNCLQTTGQPPKSQPLLHTVPTLPGLTSTLPRTHQPPASAPLFVFPLEQVKVAVGQDPKQVKQLFLRLLIYFSKPVLRNISEPIYGTVGDYHFHRNSKPNSSVTGFKEAMTQKQ